MAVQTTTCAGGRIWNASSTAPHEPPDRDVPGKGKASQRQSHNHCPYHLDRSFVTHAPAHKIHRLLAVSVSSRRWDILMVTRHSSALAMLDLLGRNCRAHLIPKPERPVSANWLHLPMSMDRSYLLTASPAAGWYIPDLTRWCC